MFHDMMRKQDLEPIDGLFMIIALSIAMCTNHERSHLCMTLEYSLVITVPLDSAGTDFMAKPESSI
jgi:hypothetical protein